MQPLKPNTYDGTRANTGLTVKKLRENDNVTFLSCVIINNRKVI